MYRSSSFDGGDVRGSVAGYYESTLKLGPNRKADGVLSCKLEWDLGSDDGISLAPTIQSGEDVSQALQAR